MTSQQEAKQSPQGNFRCIAINVVAKKRGIHTKGIKLNAHFYFMYSQYGMHIISFSKKLLLSHFVSLFFCAVCAICARQYSPGLAKKES